MIVSFLIQVDLGFKQMMFLYIIIFRVFTVKITLRNKLSSENTTLKPSFTWIFFCHHLNVY